MKRIIVCMTIVVILFAGLSFSVADAQSNTKAADGNYTDAIIHEKQGGHSKSPTDITMKDACELKSELEIQMIIRTMPSIMRETRTSATSIGCGLFLLLAICAAIISGGRKSSLISILCIRLSFQDGFSQRLRTMYQMDGKKRQSVCF